MLSYAERVVSKKKTNLSSDSLPYLETGWKSSDASPKLNHNVDTL